MLYLLQHDILSLFHIDLILQLLLLLAQTADLLLVLDTDGPFRNYVLKLPNL
jgi:hypothetical protein